MDWAAAQQLYSTWRIALISPVKLKEQGKLHAFTHAAVFHKHTLVIQCLLQNLRPEPFGDKGDLQVAAVPGVGDGTEIYDAVSVERGENSPSASRLMLTAPGIAFGFA